MSIFNQDDSNSSYNNDDIGNSTWTFNTSDSESNNSSSSSYDAPSDYKFNPSSAPVPPKPAPKKNNSWIIVVIVVIVLILIIKSCGGGSAKDTSSRNGKEPTHRTSRYEEDDDSPATPVVNDVWLDDLDPAVGNFFTYNVDSYTNTGISYSHGVHGLDDEDFVIYDIDGNYSRIAGMWAIDGEDSYGSEADYYFEIYADDVRVYTSPSITSDSRPVSFNVSISGCQRLKIVYHTNSSLYLASAAVLADTKLYS